MLALGVSIVHLTEKQGKVKPFPRISIKLVFRTSISGFNQSRDLPEFLEGWKDGRMEGKNGKFAIFP
jgi:hypothetical protein